MPQSEQLSLIRLWKSVGVLFILAAFILSLGPDVVTPSGIPHIDKVIHASSYAGLTFWFLLVYPRRLYWRIAVGFVVMGAMIEVLQYFVPYHKAEVNDAIANTIGVTTGWLLTLTPLGGVLTWVDAQLARLWDLPGVRNGK